MYFSVRVWWLLFQGAVCALSTSSFCGSGRFWVCLPSMPCWIMTRPSRLTLVSTMVMCQLLRFTEFPKVSGILEPVCTSVSGFFKGSWGDEWSNCSLGCLFAELTCLKRADLIGIILMVVMWAFSQPGQGQFGWSSAISATHCVARIPVTAASNCKSKIFFDQIRISGAGWWLEHVWWS